MSNEAFFEPLSNTVRTSFSPGILQDILHSLESCDVNMLASLVPPGKAFLDAFWQIAGWSIVEQMTGAHSWKLFLSLVQKIGNSEHFVDEWILQLPATHPIFSLDRDFLYEFANPFDLFFPSLLCLCPVPLAEPVSEYNLFLMGKFALPVYRKLGRSPSRMPSFEGVLRRYVTVDDFLYFTMNDPFEVELALAERPAMESRVLEISTSHPAAFNFESTAVPFAVAFFIRFTRVPATSFCPFLTFSSTCRLGVDPSGNLADSEGVVGEHGVADGLWHNVYFERGREKEFSLFLDGRSRSATMDRSRFRSWGRRASPRTSSTTSTPPSDSRRTRCRAMTLC
jgi:hypothetical protein